MSKKGRLQSWGNRFIKMITSSLFIILFIISLTAVIIFHILLNSNFTFHSSENTGDFLITIASPIIALSAFIVAFFTYKQKGLENEKKRIENIFFQLLNMHHEIVNSLEYELNSMEERVVKGRGYFRKVYRDLVKTYVEQRTGEPVSMEDLQRASYFIMEEKEGDHLLHYYRNLYQLVRWVTKHKGILEKHERKEYIQILKAQLSQYEISLLYIKTKHSENQEFYQLLQEYDFFNDNSRDSASKILERFKGDVKRNIEFQRKN
ncbi:cell shape-determining protein MreC [Evansella vedderi]|uniref:Cell shape-determining protein MreC n=2 Tax=Evansella vedderi TaxID=38282 RepID=A0ABT9ZZT4_9BACI|nr:cell shape-determining protein MreC [Evansella vedderi]